MIYKSLKYNNAENTVIQADKHDGSAVIIEPESQELFKLASSGALGKLAAYIPPPEPTEKQKLEAERAAMRCSTAQFVLALLDIDKLDEFEAKATRRAAIIVSRATYVYRRGEVLDSLRNMMKPTEIDALFRAAMSTPVE